jgi:hypothetical protein
MVKFQKGKFQIPKNTWGKSKILNSKFQKYIGESPK